MPGCDTALPAPAAGFLFVLTKQLLFGVKPPAASPFAAQPAWLALGVCRNHCSGALPTTGNGAQAPAGASTHLCPWQGYPDFPSMAKMSTGCKEEEEEKVAAARSMLLAVGMHGAAGYSGMDRNLQPMWDLYRLVHDNTIDTPCSTCCFTRAHTAPAMPHHAVLCCAGLSVWVQQPKGHAAGESPAPLQSVPLLPGPPRHGG